MASARVVITLSARIRMPQMDDWQTRVMRNWLGPHGVNWIVQHGPRQLERHAYPGQAAQRAVPVQPRCLCSYYTPNPLELFSTPRFRIRRSCPHHGDAALLDG